MSVVQAWMCTRRASRPAYYGHCRKARRSRRSADSLRLHKTTGNGGLVTGKRRDARGDGIDGCVLEASVEHFGGTIRDLAGECTAHQSGPRPKDGPEG